MSQAPGDSRSHLFTTFLLSRKLTIGYTSVLAPVGPAPSLAALLLPPGTPSILPAKELGLVTWKVT